MCPAHEPAQAVAAIGTGFCGALTTDSTFGFETVRLAEDSARPYALLNAAASVAAGLGDITVLVLPDRELVADRLRLVGAMG